MDVNGIDGVSGISGAGMRGDRMPLGLGLHLMTNEDAMQGYGSLTESEKERLLMSCRDARSRDEMQKIVDNMAPGTDVRAIMEEERDGRMF